MFESIRFTGADGRECTFSGRLICDVSDSIDLTDWDERYLRLQLFAIKAGGFVGAIEFLSSNYAFAKVQEVEELDDRIQVANFFFAFDPTVHVSHGRQRKSHSSMIQRRQELYAMHQQLVESVLVALTEDLAVFPDSERLAVPDATIPNRLLQFFGLV